MTAGQSALSVSLCTVGLGLALLVAGPVSEVVGRTGPDPRLAVAARRWSRCCARWRRDGACCSCSAPCSAITLAGLPAVAVAYLREEVHEDSHAKATGLYIGGTALGGMAGRLVAGGLADLGGWRLALGGIGVLALVCALLARWLLPASRHFVAAPPGRGSCSRRPAGWSASRRCWPSTASPRR